MSIAEQYVALAATSSGPDEHAQILARALAHFAAPDASDTEQEQLAARLHAEAETGIRQ